MHWRLLVLTSSVLGALAACSSADSSPANSNVGAGNDASTSEPAKRDIADSAQNDGGVERDVKTAPPADGSCMANAPFDPVPWKPPTPMHQNKCTSKQITTFATHLAAGPPVTSGDDTCDQCLMTLPTAAAHGPMIANAAQEVLAVNFGGCYASLDGDSSESGCGPNINHSNQCLKVECSQCGDYTTHGPLTLACIKEARLAGNPCEGTALRDECKAQTTDAGFQECNSSTSLMTLWCGP